jgi:hypothetical protein
VACVAGELDSSSHSNDAAKKHFHVQLRELSVKCAVERRASPAPLDRQGNQNSIAGIYEFAVASTSSSTFETW